MSVKLSLDEIKRSLPEFDIIREIEEGNIKRVFEAKHNGEKVALKIVPYDDSKGRLEGYTSREIDIMQTIRSDILVDLKHASEKRIGDYQAYIIVEEFIDGQTLKSVIESGRYGPRLGIRVASAILQVLPEFNEHSIVHRDIKPENLMISQDGDVRLLDVGVARMNERETLTPDFNQSGPGTKAYSAPEVLQNDRDNQNVRTDIFSTGIVFFESITGDHPFNFPEMRVTEAIMQGKRKNLEGYVENRSVENRLDMIYKKMTELEPVDRYRLPDHAVDDLNAVIGEIV